MKRSFFASLILFSVAGLAAGCGSPTETNMPVGQEQSDWTATPVVKVVLRTAQGVRVSGSTSPQGRVVLRGGDGPAYATGSDEEGRFSMVIDRPTRDGLFVVESRRGEQVALAPYEVLIAADERGPIALVGEGTATLRLDSAGPLDAIDSDGRALLASGRAPPQSEVLVRIGERMPLPVVSNAEGRWSLNLMLDGAGPITVVVGERRYVYPGPGSPPAEGAPVLASVGEGWQIVRSLAPGSWQSSWFPAG